MIDTEMDFEEMARQARVVLEREREKLEERAGQLADYLRLLDIVDELQAENRRLKESLDEERQQREEDRRTIQELEMKLSELTKLSAGVAKKSSNEEVLKAIRAFVNNSKRKRIDKRTAVKEMVMELAMTNGISYPEDLAATIESLDDEQPEGKKPIGQIVMEQNNYGVPPTLPAADSGRLMESSVDNEKLIEQL